MIAEALLCIVLGGLAARETTPQQGAGPQLAELDAFIERARQEDHVMGLSAAVFDGEGLLWSCGYGWADREEQVPMTAKTLLNIGSISKTVTCTAVLQLWEAGLFELDDDVNGYLPFPVRNPAFPDEPITFRQLLAHRSSIQDGDAYDASYTPGDPEMELGTWLREYFHPEGEFYDPEQNFHRWRPGTVDPPAQPRAYSNLGFGLLGYLVERIGKKPFPEYCQRRIFEPLGMDGSGWRVADIDTTRHAVPYTYLEEDLEGPLEEHQPRYADERQPRKAGESFPHRLYSFPNYPDGALRTDVEQLAKHVRAILNGGSLAGEKGRILGEDTVAYMLSREHFGEALCWDRTELAGGGVHWGHNGGDPGIVTLMAFDPVRRRGAIVFCTGSVSLRVFDRLLSDDASIDKMVAARGR